MAPITNSQSPPFRAIPDKRIDSVDLLDVLDPIEEVNASPALAWISTHSRYDTGVIFERKLEALAAYADEMRQFPRARSIEAHCHLANLPGASKDVPAAEVFETGPIFI